MIQNEKIKIGVLGASGRAGKEVLRALQDFPNFELRRAVVGSRSDIIGMTVPGADNVGYEALTPAALVDVDLWIDFSTPEGSSQFLSQAIGTPLVILTTGHGAEFGEAVGAYAETAPVLVCPNASLGIFAAKIAAKRVKEILGDRFDIEISEIHHRGKVDAPSGTALSLGQELAASPSEDLLYGGNARKGPRKPKEISISALRGGDVVGEHTIYFLGDGERIEITHRASDRAIFARGALVLGEKLLTRRPGLYKVDDLFQA